MNAFLALVAAVFTLDGRIDPGRTASVTLHGATSSFQRSVLSDPGGRFRFNGLDAGSYTLSVFVPGIGESRQTVVIGAGLADARGRVQVVVRLVDERLKPDRSSVVSVRELSIPRKAREEYQRGVKCLEKRDDRCADQAMSKAVELAPQFAEAWNHLGTLAYHRQEYSLAAERFRKSLMADPKLYAPLVNLGGVLLNLNEIDDAWKYNVNAVLREPRDALANSQLGMTYLASGKLDLSEKYLLEARRLDPAHFSHPQLSLAEVYLRRKQWGKAADQLEEFVRLHPDYRFAAKVKSEVERLRSLEP